MLIVETLGKPRYISGIYEKKTEKDECVRKQRYAHDFEVVVKSVNIKFPFYVIEEGRNCGNCFRSVTLGQLLRVIREIDRDRDDEHTYMNVYYVGGSFEPRKAGADEMSRLPHVHVCNEWLLEFDERGPSLISEFS